MTFFVYAAAGGGLLLLLYLLAIKPARAAAPPVRWYAHRGLYDNSSDAPENTLRAFERAAEAGCGIELDIRLTEDLVPVAFHDADLKRLCGAEGRIDELSWEQLKAYRILGTDQGIPRLEDVLALVSGRVPLLLEYKLDSTDASVCICAERILKDYRGDYCMESFHPFALLWYRHNRPEIARGILSTDYAGSRNRQLAVMHFFSRHLLFNFFAKPHFIAYDCRVKRELSRFLCAKLYGSCLAAWTVKGREQLEEIRDRYQWYIFEGFRP